MTWKTPAFFENDTDDNHCLQAAIMIVLSSMGHPVRRAEVEAGTNFKKNLYTWSIEGAAYLAKFVSGVQLYSILDYAKFAQNGESYLREFWTPAHFGLQKSKASQDFKKEQVAAERFISSGTFELIIPPKEKLISSLKENLIIAMVGVNRLYPERGQGVHFIVLYAHADGMIHFHDPGLPPRPRSRLPKDRVYSALNDELLVVPLGTQKFGLVEGDN